MKRCRCLVFVFLSFFAFFTAPQAAFPDDSEKDALLENLRRARIDWIENASFFAGDAAETEKFLEQAERARGEKIRPDVVILDPPRKGCDARLLSFVASLSPRTIVYVSCGPDTLARDMAILKPLGYVSDKVQPVDMVPGTGHVESVVCLTRSDKAT